MTHKCPVESCSKQQPQNILMCAGHWRMVPRDIQRQVLDGWHKGSGNYMAARQAAINAVNKKEFNEQK